MVYAYIRFSTLAQEETQQMFALEQYAASKSLTIDVVEKDEGISGGVSYKDRKLAKIVKRLKEGDTLIVTEISRLGRSMSDLNKLVNDELVPRKARLIVTKMGIDLNCAKISAVDQMLLYAFSFSAQLEKEMIVQRTQSAIDARKAMIKRDGGFISKSGNFCDHLGRKKGEITEAAIAAMSLKRSEISRKWKNDSPLFTWVAIQTLKGRTFAETLEEAGALFEQNPERYCTKQGKKLGPSTLARWREDILKRG